MTREEDEWMRSPLKRVGKKVKAWNKARTNLKKEYEEKGITFCELRLKGCKGNSFLGFAHRYKRTDPRCEHIYKETLLACVVCHDLIENNRGLTEEMFKKLRGI